MANTEIITLIIQMAKEVLTYLLPVIGAMAGITFVFSWIHSVTLGSTRKIFRD